jgi:hypothetical protein
MREGAQIDARHERAHGCAVSADEARRRAVRRAETGKTMDAVYWAAYAAEVESWEEQ